MDSGRKKRLGQEGEDWAADFLTYHGLKIIARNFRCPVGEMDIIAQEGDKLVFIEVRTRTTEQYGWGEESITPRKRLRLRRIAEYFLQSRKWNAWPMLRFDLMAIRWDPREPKVNWIRGME